MSVGRVGRDADTAEFLDGTGRGVFVLRRCTNCGAVNGPQAGQCAVCESDKVVAEPASGSAKVVSWIVTHGRPDASGRSARSVVVIGELDEGPWWWAQVCDADPEDMAVGMRLRIDFARPPDGGEAVPVYRLAPELG